MWFPGLTLSDFEHVHWAGEKTQSVKGLPGKDAESQCGMVHLWNPRTRRVKRQVDPWDLLVAQ